MSSIEFKYIFEQADLVKSGQLKEVELNIAFFLAKQTTVDELQGYESYECNYIEFLEALARAAHILSPMPVIYIDKQDRYKWNYEKRNQQPLHMKIEGLMVILLKKCCDKWLKQTFPVIQQSIFDPDFYPYPKETGFRKIEISHKLIKNDKKID